MQSKAVSVSGLKMTSFMTHLWRTRYYYICLVFVMVGLVIVAWLLSPNRASLRQELASHSNVTPSTSQRDSATAIFEAVFRSIDIEAVLGQYHVTNSYEKDFFYACWDFLRSGSNEQLFVYIIRPLHSEPTREFVLRDAEDRVVMRFYSLRADISSPIAIITSESVDGAVKTSVRPYGDTAHPWGVTIARLEELKKAFKHK
jgi:hypothetical protein